MSSPDIDEEIRLADEAYNNYDYSTAVAGYKRALDIVTRQADSYQRDKRRGEIFLQIVDALDMSGKWLDALMYVNMIVNIASLKKDIMTEIRAHLKAASILTKRGMWKEAKKRYLDILQVAKKQDKSSATADCYYGLAYVAWRLGDTDSAMINVKKTLNMVDNDENSQHLRGQSLILLATLTDNLGNTQLSINKFEEAIVVLEKVDDLVELARAYNNLGEVYKRLEDYHTATVQYKKCIVVARQSNDKHTEAYGLTNAAECLARENKLAEAERDIEKAGELLSSIQDPYASAATNLVRGIIAFNKKDQNTTHEEFKAAIDTLEKLEAPYDLGIVSLEYGKALQALGQKEEAYKMYAKAKISFEKTDAKHYLQKTENIIKELTSS